MPLRGYQQETINQVMHHWNAGRRKVMPVLPTGSGKTVVMAHTAALKRPGTLGLAMAHRGELVAQISIALARQGLAHNLIASKGDIRTICDMHMEKLGRVLFNSAADWNVASVDTLIGRKDVDRWAPHVSMAFGDEAHHFLVDNKWGRQATRFENAFWMLPTATPLRADGKGLGSHASGIVDALVVGPDMRWMIDNGYLTNFVVRTPTAADLDMSDVKMGSGGDYVQDDVRRAAKRSKRLVGDIVQTYIDNTMGMRGIVFAADVEHGKKIAAEFAARGIPCEFLDGTDVTGRRRDVLKRFESGELKVLVNVDLFGEGFDLPAIEVVMFARPTASYALYVQQWGRALRLLISDALQGAWDTYSVEQRLGFIASSAKPIAHIHDHVGNMFHFKGPPTKPVEWSLDDRERKGGNTKNGVLMRRCTNPMCQEPYERWEPACPYCGTEPPVPVSPAGPKEVDGDLHLFTREMLDELFKTIATVDNPRPQYPFNASQVVLNSVDKNHRERQAAQETLRQIMPMVLPAALGDRRAQRRFFARYGVDVLTAKTLGAKDANNLREKILADLKGE